MSLSPLKWVRPTNVPYPNVWMTFMERDLHDDKLVEYRIQDLPESLFDEAIAHMLENYVRDEPISQVFDGINDPEHVNDYIRLWRAFLAQKTVLVCLKGDSKEIVGLNMNYVSSEGDTFFTDAKKLSKSKITDTIMKVLDVSYKDFDVYKVYGTREYLSSLGLTVSREFRGRRIGQRLLEARRSFCQTFGIKVTHTVFSSDFANVVAEKAGFKIDVQYTYDEIAKTDPALKFDNIKSKGITGRTLVF